MTTSYKRWVRCLMQLTLVGSFTCATTRADEITESAMSAPPMSVPGPLVFESGDQLVQLLELYTSQGCNSCPPADAWLSQFTESSELWRSIVPVAWHVDYWNYLGWEDRFAQSEFGKRQRNYVLEGAAKQVHTPAFVLHGHEWRPQGDGFANLSSQSPGRLTATVSQTEVRVIFAPTRPTGKTLFANVALLGFGLTTPVRGGENNHQTLTEDFVVLQHTAFGLTPTDHGLVARSSLPRDNNVPGRKALAIWITNEREQKPIQSAGGWLEFARP